MGIRKSRRLRVMCAWLLAMIVPLVAVAQREAEAPGRRNIVFILADDQRNDMLGCYGNPLIQTPTLDRLAAEGVRFDNFFCQTPICATSRATILTGLSQRTHGFNFGTPPVPARYIATSYPAYLKANGYRTGFTGKFGLRYGENDKDEQFDFYKPYGRNPYLHSLPDGTLRHETDRCADAAIEFIRTNPPGKPFCMSVSFNAPHAEDTDRRPGFHFQWPASADGLYEGAGMPLPIRGDGKYFAALPPFLQEETELSRARYFWRWDTPEKYQVNMRAYYRMVTGIDHAVGRILEALKSAGLDQNTVVVYTADQGLMMGDRGLAGKWNHYDQSLRVPFIVYDPMLSAEKRGRVVTELGTLLDVAPTIVEWAGLKQPDMYQGRSLVDLIADASETAWRRDFFCEHHFRRYNNWRGVRSERYKYAVYYDEPTGPYECLYDLERDPDEFDNLAMKPEYNALRSRMGKRLSSYLEAYPQGVAGWGPAPVDLAVEDYEKLLERKIKLQGAGPDAVSERQALRKRADRALGQKIVTLLRKQTVPPSGDKRDYMSQAPYWWPDPKQPDGLPYIRRDGRVNPESRGATTDIEARGRFFSTVNRLGLAAFHMDEPRYAERVVEWLEAWFVDSRTRMNPHLQYAQYVPGSNQGRCFGIIEWCGIDALITPIELLRAGGYLSEPVCLDIRAWFEEYLDWLLTSENGRQEGAAFNNHGTWYDVQVAGILLFLGRRAEAASLLESVKTHRIATQIEPDGRQPHELARTKSLSYSKMNLSAFKRLAGLGESVDVDLWNYETEDGRSIRAAETFLEPYLSGKKKWPYPELGQDSGGDARMRPSA